MNLNNIVWSCPCDCSGYSQCGRDYVIALHQNGWNVLYETPVVSTLLDGFGIDHDTREVLLELTKTKISKPYIRISHSVPSRFVIDENAELNIGYTVVETEIIPDGWAFLCNKMDAIFTASSFCKEILINNGVTVPVFVIPHCHDEKKLDLNSKFNISNLKSYNFLFMADMTPRKGWKYLVESFCREFDKDEDVSLTFKVYFRDFTKESQDECKKKIKDFANQLGYNININTAPIYFYGHCLPNNLINKFINSFDCVVSPHCGEGWGLVLSQSMFLTKLTIATNYSGNLEFMNHDNSMLIPVSHLEKVPDEMVEINPNYSGLEWPVPDINELMKMLRLAKENGFLCQKLARNANIDIINKYNYSKIAKLIDNSIVEIFSTIKEKTL